MYKTEKSGVNSHEQWINAYRVGFLNLATWPGQTSFLRLTLQLQLGKLLVTGILIIPVLNI